MGCGHGFDASGRGARWAASARRRLSRLALAVGLTGLASGAAANTVVLSGNTVVGDVTLLSGQCITGFGTVQGKVWASAPDSVIEAVGGNLTLGDGSTQGFVSSGHLDVGANVVTLLDSNGAFLSSGSQTTLAGGTLQAPASFITLSGAGSTLTGFGTVGSRFSSTGGSLVTASGGSLTLGDAALTNGVVLGGFLDVGAQLVTLLDADAAELSSQTTIAGGTLSAANGIFLGIFAGLDGFGTVAGNVSGSVATISASGGSLVLGNAASTAGFDLAGTLVVGAQTVTLLDADYATLGGVTTLAGGTLNAANGLQLGASESLSGFGSVAAPWQGVSGSSISATGSLSLGSAASAAGVSHAGSLAVGNHTVTLLDANFAQLGATTLTGGTLVALNGINAGSLTGSGLVIGPLSGVGITANAVFDLSQPLALGANPGRVISNGTTTATSSVSLAGGTLTAPSGILFAGGSSLSGFGAVAGPVQGASGAAITASGGSLGLGSAASPSGFDHAGSLDVGSQSVTLLDANFAQLGSTTTLGGGSLLAANGVEVGSGESLVGAGSVVGKLLGQAGSSLSATGSLQLGDASSTSGFVTSGTLAVGSQTVTVLDADFAQLGSSTTIGAGGQLVATNGVSLGASTSLTGGTISAAAGVDLAGGGSLTGSGSVTGRVLGQAGSSISATGSLALGDAATPSGFATAGTLAVGSGTVTLLDADKAQLGSSTTIGSGGLLLAANGVDLGGATTLSGGTLSAAGGVELGAGETLSGFGSVGGGDFRGRSDSLISASGGNLAVGNAASFTGFRTDGDLAVASGATLTLNSASFATLGAVNTLANGTLAAPNGAYLGGASILAGSGALSGRLAAANGSTIVATGNLALGSASAYDGFFSDGVLQIGANSVTLHDQNEAVLGSLTTIAGGTLAAPNDLLLNPGRNLVGFGLVTADLVNNGDVVGQAPSLTFSGAVSGCGGFAGSVVFSGSFSPGCSPGLVELENVSFLGSAELRMELAGLAPGSEHDQLDIGGTAHLDGTLVVELIDGFLAQEGQSFELLRYGARLGEFAALRTPNLGDALRVDLDYGATSLVARIAAVPEPDTLALMSTGLAGLAMLGRRRGA